MKHYFTATVENGSLEITPFRKWFIKTQSLSGASRMTTHQMRGHMKRLGWVIKQFPDRVLVTQPAAESLVGSQGIETSTVARMKKEKKGRVSNERKNLNRLAGEFLVASRLAQRGFMVSLQWGTTIGYDLLVFDKEGSVAFVEVKSGAQESRRWILQKKYAFPREDKIDPARRFVCCVDLAIRGREPDIYVFPCEIVAKGIRYFFSGRYPNSSSFHLSLDFKPQGQTKTVGVETVGEHIGCDSYKENFAALGVKSLEG